jgi:hypothetical protein
MWLLVSPSLVAPAHTAHTHTHLLCTRWTCGSFALARFCNQPAANWWTRHSIGPLCRGFWFKHCIQWNLDLPLTSQFSLLAKVANRISNLFSFPWYLVLENLFSRYTKHVSMNAITFPPRPHRWYWFSFQATGACLVQFFLRTDIDSSLATRAQSCWACSRLAAVYITGSFFSLRRTCVILESSFHCPLEQEPDHAASHSLPSLRVAISVTASTKIHWWEQHHLSDATTQESIFMRSSRLPFWVALILSVELARHCSCRHHRLLWYWVICIIYHELSEFWVYIEWVTGTGTGTGITSTTNTGTDGTGSPFYQGQISGTGTALLARKSDPIRFHWFDVSAHVTVIIYSESSCRIFLWHLKFEWLRKYGILVVHFFRRFS